jgi:hypothetical protein
VHGALLGATAALAIVAVIAGIDRLTTTAPVNIRPVASLEAAPPPDKVPGATVDPSSVAPCGVDDLALAAGGWGGATGSMAGGATVINMSNDRCRVEGKPVLSLLAKGGRLIAAGGPAIAGDPIVLLPGQVTGVITVWSNWCGDPPARPLRLRLSLIDAPRFLEAEVQDWQQPGVIGGDGGGSVPRCDLETAPSAIDAPLPFAAREAPDPPDPSNPAEACTTDELSAYLGSWGAAAGTSYAYVAVLNRAGIDCLLQTSPPLELRDADGALVLNAERWPEGDSTFDLPAGWAAVTSLGFANWCVAPPKLPFRFDLLIGSAELDVAPTSERSTIGAPDCMSPGNTQPPSLGYSGPFRLPGLPDS